MRPGILLYTIQHFQALQVKPFIVKDPCVVHLLMQLNVNVIFIVEQPETGQHLPVKVSFDIGELLLFY
jgi:hypothetical protein